MMVILLLCLCAASCRTRREVVEMVRYEQRTDTVRDTRVRVDSVVVRDSIVTVIRGDTVTRDRWHTQLHERVRVDTVERVKMVTEYETRTERVDVPRALAWWQTALMWLGAVSLAAGVVMAVLWIKWKI